jgi:FAD/FMN-containing dehydrogenase
MTALKVRTRNGGEVSLEDSALKELDEAVSGDVITPSHADYDDVRTIWNAMIDRRPGLLIRCINAQDVVYSVKFAAENNLLVAVRGAGHNIAGSAMCEGGLVIDLSQMKSVQVDPEAQTAKVEPGVTLGDLDAATQIHGLAIPVGINSTTGIAGLTLGGGFGWLSRKHGLTIDNLLSADVVTADGKLVTASENQHQDLFWGIRGGGGNLGVVTSFEFQLHPVGPDVFSGLIVFPQEEAPSLLRQYREFTAHSPDELTSWVVLRKAPPLPFLPQDVHGTDIMAIAVLYCGDLMQGEKAVEPIRGFGNAHGDALMPHKFTDFQAAFDPLLTPGARNYWKSHNFAELSDEALNMITRYAGALPSDQSEIFIAQMGGATNRVAQDATAYQHRDAQFVMNVHTRWDDPGDDTRCIAWAREFFEATAPHASGGVYVNFMTEDETDRVRAAYGVNYDRMVTLKKRYDPSNLFSLNQNIRP